MLDFINFVANIGIITYLALVVYTEFYAEEE